MFMALTIKSNGYSESIYNLCSDNVKYTKLKINFVCSLEKPCRIHTIKALTSHVEYTQ